MGETVILAAFLFAGCFIGDVIYEVVWKKGK